MFRVEWKNSALDELTALWLAADSEARKAITEASHEIDQRLRGDPESQGESRPDGRRIFFVPPLGVRYRVYPEHSLVGVLQVWRF